GCACVDCATCSTRCQPAGGTARGGARLFLQVHFLAHSRRARRADAVAELGLAAVADVDLHRPPGALRVTDLFAVEADRKDTVEHLPAAQLGDVHERHGNAMRRARARADQRMGAQRDPDALAVVIAPNAHDRARRGQSAAQRERIGLLLGREWGAVLLDGVGAQALERWPQDSLRAWVPTRDGARRAL